MPIARAAAGVRSMTRPGTNGPLSLMVTRTDLPLRLLVTRAREPSRLQTKKPNHRHDSLLCARRYRPCCRCTDNRFDEVAASHVAHSCSRSGEILFEPVPKRHGSWPGLKVRSGLRTCQTPVASIATCVHSFAASHSDKAISRAVVVSKRAELGKRTLRWRGLLVLHLASAEEYPFASAPIRRPTRVVAWRGHM
jgi:hypothetical protein